MTTPHGLPRDVPAHEATEDARPILIPVATGLGPDGISLFIGNLAAAEDPAALQAAGITDSLNTALNLFPGPLALPDGTMLRRLQLGMVDGPGNDPHLLLAAVLALHAVVSRHMPGKPHYPPARRGHVLVHCRGGRSRSTTVLALYLHLHRAAQFPTLSAALDHLRQLRGLDAGYPLPPMIALAEAACALPHPDLAAR